MRPSLFKVTAPERSPNAPPNFGYLCCMAAAAALLCIAVAIPARSEHLTRVYLLEQDLVVFTMALLVLASAWFMPREWFTRFLTMPSTTITVGAREIGLGMAAVILLGVSGHFLIMHGYAFSRDEQMVLFDADVFASGHLVGSIPQAWRALVDAMNLTFLIVTPGNTTWISSYLPVNAMLHAPAAMLGMDSVVNPILAAIGMFATWQVARQLWPKAQEPAVIAVILYITSTQMWAASMTSYAMTGHLALNMVWLMCFLRGDRLGHAGAILIGFAATGLHQVIFHPLFALPFLTLLVFRRDWALVALYAVAYALIGLFWISYVQWTIYAGAPATTHEIGGLAGYIERIQSLLTGTHPNSLALMAANIFRFFAWQNLLMLPLLALAINAIWRSREPLHVAMLAALLLTPMMMFVLLAYQGHGWGYRYMHGLIGVACLLAVVGWQELRAQSEMARRALITATAATLLLCTPYLLWHSRNLVSSYATADRMINRLNADIAVIDDKVSGLAQDLAINMPYPGATPLRLMASKLAPKQLSKLCEKHSVVRIDNIGRTSTAVMRKICP